MSWLVAASVAIAGAAGCGDENEGTTSTGSGGSTSSTTGTGGGTSSSSSSSSTGTGGSGGDGGGGGGGGAPTDQGVSATETVSAGHVVKSAGHTMVFTIGQPTQNQGILKSSGHRLQGGLIGATGSLK